MKVDGGQGESFNTMRGGRSCRGPCIYTVWPAIISQAPVLVVYTRTTFFCQNKDAFRWIEEISLEVKMVGSGEGRSLGELKLIRSWSWRCGDAGARAERDAVLAQV